MTIDPLTIPTPPVGSQCITDIALHNTLREVMGVWFNMTLTITFWIALLALGIGVAAGWSLRNRQG